MRPIPAHKLTWWTCRVCNRVRAYTEADLQEIPGGRPLCELHNDGVRRFMQKIKFSEE